MTFLHRVGQAIGATLPRMAPIFGFGFNEPPDAIQAVIEATGNFYEVAALRLLRELLPANPRIVDIGANFGNHSVYFARICGAAQVLSIEPNPEIIPELRANLAANECTADLSCLGVAIGARRSQLHLCLDPADAVISNRGGTRLVDNVELATGPAVPVVPLDELVTGEIDLVRSMSRAWPSPYWKAHQPCSRAVRL